MQTKTKKEIGVSRQQADNKLTVQGETRPALVRFCWLAFLFLVLGLGGYRGLVAEGLPRSTANKSRLEGLPQGRRIVIIKFNSISTGTGSILDHLERV